MASNFLESKLAARSESGSLRQLKLLPGLVDFCSNDYLGLARQPVHSDPLPSGSGGSRLLSGNSARAENLEAALARFHEAEAALIFNSGYDANLGLLSCVPQRGDTILYDYLSHASLRDGIRLSFADSHAFAHNDLDELETRLKKGRGRQFVVTESVFSMDGDQAPLKEMAAICQRYAANLIVDEAHATGIIGPRGVGLVQALELQSACFARIHTFGKALGCHGAAVLGSQLLKDYLINFSRPFIYTTALPEASLFAIENAYSLFPEMEQERMRLQELTAAFARLEIPYLHQASATPIQAVQVPGNQAVSRVARYLQQAGLDVRPIVYPTVPAGTERLRIVLHSYNTHAQLMQLAQLLQSSSPVKE